MHFLLFLNPATLNYSQLKIFSRMILNELFGKMHPSLITIVVTVIIAIAIVITNAAVIVFLLYR